MKLIKLSSKSRKDFFSKDEYAQYRQVHALASLILKLGGTPELIKNVLEKEDGHFISWDFMFED